MAVPAFDHTFMLSVTKDIKIDSVGIKQCVRIARIMLLSASSNMCFFDILDLD